MIHKISKERYPQAETLFHKLSVQQPMCAAVLEGIYPGAVHVDDPQHPTTGFLSTTITGEEEGVWGYLAGNPGNTAFNQALNEAISSRRLVSGSAPHILLTCDSKAWYEHISSILAPRDPIPMPRRHYSSRKMDFAWRENLPDGFAVERMGPELSGRVNLILPESVQKIIHKWQRFESPEFIDFGFVVIDEGAEIPQVVSWATIDFIARGMGDLGFFTQDSYRRRGLGTAAAAAAVEHGLAHGLSTVHWTCAENNTGSIRTADKLGFVRGEDYTIHYIMFDEAEHLGALAYSHLEAGRYQAAVDLIEEVIGTRDDPPKWLYLDAATGWAALENAEKAFYYLNTLAEKGWKNPATLQNMPEFGFMKDRPEWAVLMNRIKQNREKKS